MRRPFQIAGRAGWSAEVEHKDGRSQRRLFPTRDKASAWLHEAQAAIEAEFLPALGGPAAVTLYIVLASHQHAFVTARDREVFLPAFTIVASLVVASRRAKPWKQNTEINPDRQA